MKSNNDIIVTVIVPVYKVEPYIEQCVRSLMEQTVQKGVEILFLNDGTPDNSIELINKTIQEYPNNKSKTRIISNKVNCGVTFTRKEGVKNAQGEYIAWVDGDDWVERNWLESLLSATENKKNDIVIQNVTRNYFTNKGAYEEEQFLFSTTSPQQALKHFWTEKHVPRGLPYQMSRKSLLVEALQHVSAVNYTEDTFTLIYLFHMAKSVKWLEKSFYHYRKVENKTTLTSCSYRTKEEWKKQKVNIDNFEKYLREIGEYNQYRTSLNYIKWSWKREFKKIFDYPSEYWHEYKECYKDINNFYGINGFIARLSTWCCTNCYILFLLRLKLKRGNDFYKSL